MKRNTFLAAISLLLCMSFLFSSALTVAVSAAEAKQKPEMGSFEEILASYYDSDGRPMSCAHRAISYIGNPIPENSLAAIQDCIDHKVDIVELDIMRTKDGVYVLCHDYSIKRTTTYTGSLKVSQMTYAEICQYPLLQHTGGSSPVYLDENGNTLVMPTFEDALKLCKGKIMINLDKFTDQWSNRMELYEIVKKHGCLDLVIFKGNYNSSTIRSWHNEIKAKYGDNAVMPNFATLSYTRHAESWVNEIKAHHDAKTAYTVETDFSDYSQTQSNSLYIAQIKQYARVFINVLYDSLGGTYSAKNRENSTGWAEIISIGYNIIQTNSAADLAAYIYANYSTLTRDIAEGIDLLYFSGFKHTQTDYTIEIMAPSVKMYNGDFVSFKNVDFRNCDANSLIVQITGASGGGELVVRRDSRKGTILAKFDLTDVGDGNVSLVEEISPEGLDICDIYVCAEKMGSGYVLASKMICADPMAGAIKRVEGMSIFTRPDVAPVLPTEVTVINEFGITYDSEVVWSPIPEECYSEELSFFTVPGVLKANCQTIYANVTVLDLDLSGAAVWFDAQGDKEMGEYGEVFTWYDRINSVAATAKFNETPIYRDGVISFDGGNDSMIYNHSLSNKGNISIIINAKTNRKATDYLSGYKINNTSRYTLIHYPESGAWGSVYFTAFKDGIACRFGSGETDNRGIYYTGKTINGWATVSAVKNGTSEKFYVGATMVYDRSADTASTYQMGNPGAKVNATHKYAYIGLGSQSSTNYYYQGQVGDIVIFERSLSLGEIETLTYYFSAKNRNGLRDKSDIVEAEFTNFLNENGDKVHAFTYASADADTHTATCAVCGYSVTEAHACAYTKQNGRNHIKTCTLCAYTGEEAHDYQSVVTEDGKTAELCSGCAAEKSGLVLVVVIAASVLVVAAGVFVVMQGKKKKSL